MAACKSPQAFKLWIEWINLQRGDDEIRQLNEDSVYKQGRIPMRADLLRCLLLPMCPRNVPLLETVKHTSTAANQSTCTTGRHAYRDPGQYSLRAESTIWPTGKTKSHSACTCTHTAYISLRHAVVSTGKIRQFSTIVSFSHSHASILENKSTNTMPRSAHFYSGVPVWFNGIIPNPEGVKWSREGW